MPTTVHSFSARSNGDTHTHTQQEEKKLSAGAKFMLMNWNQVRIFLRCVFFHFTYCTLNFATNYALGLRASHSKDDDNNGDGRSKTQNEIISSSVEHIQKPYRKTMLSVAATFFFSVSVNSFGSGVEKSNSTTLHAIYIVAEKSLAVFNAAIFISHWNRFYFLCQSFGWHITIHHWYIENRSMYSVGGQTTV